MPTIQTTSTPKAQDIFMGKYPKRIFEFLKYQKDHYPQEVCMAYKLDGEWKTFSTDEVIDIVDRLSMGFHKKGIKQNDKVGVISWNRPEWNFVDLALQQIGAISVPMYANITVEDYGCIIRHSEVKMLFVSDLEMTEKVKKGIELSGKEVELFTFDLLHEENRWDSILIEETPEARKKLEASILKQQNIIVMIYRL